MRHGAISAILLALACPAAWGQETRGDRVFGQVVRIEITGVADEIQGDEICRRVPKLMPPGEYVTRFSPVSAGKLVARVAPIPDVKAFAAKIDFGKVTKIQERTIYVTAKPVSGAGTAAANPLNRALEGLKSSSADIRHSALEQLIDMPPNRSRAEVVSALQGPLRGTDSRAKALAVEALGTWAGKASVPTMLKLLDSRDYRDAGPRSAAIQVLRQFKDPSSIEPIARRLADVSDRPAAIKALIAFGPAAERTTLGVLASKDSATRIGACEILAKIGTKASVAPLLSASRDTDKRVQSAATRALKSVNKRLK